MTDTLRSIADKWREAEKTMAEGGTIEVDRRWLHGYATGTVMSECAAELEALLAEYEIDLVKTWREPNVNVRCDENGGSVSYDTSYDATRLQCAAELETWLAVNLERIKSEHYADGFDAGASAIEKEKP